MYAIRYKLKQLMRCNQVWHSCCDSSNGNISLHSIVNSHNLFPHAIYNTYQTQLTNKTSKKPINTICTWNIQELWWHSYHQRKIRNIIDHISKSQFDVFCLQEVFETDVLNAILNNKVIRKQYPYYLTGNLCSRFIFGESSGLLVLSSQPIVFRQFTPFYKTSCPDTFASKGALYFTIGEINFITTHLQSGNIPLALNQLKGIIKNSPFSHKTILLGDLNIPDPFSFLRIARNNFQHTHDSGRTLDHIIPLTSDIKLDSIVVDYINLKNTSDHWPVTTKII